MLVHKSKQTYRLQYKQENDVFTEVGRRLVNRLKLSSTINMNVYHIDGQKFREVITKCPRQKLIRQRNILSRDGNFACNRKPNCRIIAIQGLALPGNMKSNNPRTSLVSSLSWRRSICSTLLDSSTLTFRVSTRSSASCIICRVTLIGGGNYLDMQITQKTHNFGLSDVIILIFSS